MSTERMGAMGPVAASSPHPAPKVMVAAADQLTSMLLADRVSDQGLDVTQIGLACMAERSRSRDLDLVVAVPPASLLDYIEGGWHDAMVRLDQSTALAVIADPRVPVRSLPDTRRAGAGLALLDATAPMNISALLSALRSAISGRHIIDPAFAADRQGSVRWGFSAAERPVLELLAIGYSNLAIAELLYISERTVETHIRQIFQRLGLRDDRSLNRRVIAARLAFDGAAEVPIDPPRRPSGS